MDLIEAVQNENVYVITNAKWPVNDKFTEDATNFRIWYRHHMMRNAETNINLWDIGGYA